MNEKLEIRALIVDDEPIILNDIKNTLDWAGAGVSEVFTADSAEDALEFTCLDKIDILITDIRMGKMTGLDLIQIIKSKNPELNSIVLTVLASG